MLPDLEELSTFISEFNGPSTLIVFLILLACGLGVPIPEDITLVAGGMMVSEKMSSFRGMFAVCMAGILIGDCCIYWFGRIFGHHIFKTKFLARIFNEKFMAIGQTAFDRFGTKIIFFARFMPGLRAPIYFFAGYTKTSFLFFLLIDTFAALISVPIWIYVGYFFNDNLPALKSAIMNLQIGTVAVVLFFVALLIGFHYLKKRIGKLFGQ